MPNSVEHAEQKSLAASHSTKPKKPQLEAWLEKTETHEQMIAGHKSSRSFARTMHLLEETDEKLERDFK